MLPPTPDPLEPWSIPSQEWDYFIPETLEQLREPVDNVVDNSDGPKTR